MALSVNTNAAAAGALQQLAITNKSLNQTQLNITTGLKVNGPKDDASTYAIAQNLRRLAKSVARPPYALQCIA